MSSNFAAAPTANDAPSLAQDHGRTRFDARRHTPAYLSEKLKLEFGLQLFALMKKSSISVNELGARINRNPSCIRAVLTGSRDISVEFMVAAVEACGGRLSVTIQGA